MADRPMPFSSAMILALLAGRKTQTRRILKPQPPQWTARVIDITQPFFCEEEGGWGQIETIWSGPLELGMCEPEREEWRPLKGLRIAVGDRLWVRETLECANGEAVGYPADGTWLPNTPWMWRRQKLPSIHMPRHLSRLTLHVTDVRVERLQDIKAIDILAEGVRCDGCFDTGKSACRDRGCFASRIDFRALWTSTHGDGAWEANPWVCALTFDVEHANIDAKPAIEVREIRRG